MSGAIRVLCIGDPHFKATNASQTDALEDTVINLINEAAEDSDDYDAVFVLGDILHHHDRIDLHVMCRAVNFLKKIRSALKSKSYLVVIIGNHDLPNNSTYCSELHAFVGLKNWANTIVADAPTPFTVKSHRILALPFIPTGRFAEAVEPFDLDDFDCVLAHQEFLGCKLSNGIYSKRGDVYPESAPLCISGHIHSFSRLGKNVLYPGTPFEHHWSSGEDDCGLLEVLLDGTRSPKYERIALENVGRNMTVDFKSLDAFEQALEKKSLSDALGITVTALDRIRVRIECTSRTDFARRTLVSKKSPLLSRVSSVTIVPIVRDEPFRKTLAVSEPASSCAKPFREILCSSFANEEPSVRDFVSSVVPNARIFN